MAKQAKAVMRPEARDVAKELSNLRRINHNLENKLAYVKRLRAGDVKRRRAGDVKELASAEQVVRMQKTRIGKLEDDIAGFKLEVENLNGIIDKFEKPPLSKKARRKIAEKMAVMATLNMLGRVKKFL